MSDTILGGDIRVDYFDDNRWKSLTWIGAGTGTQDMNAVYSAMATLLDEATTGDDATCMKADTPVEYTVGILDANDNDPWYMGYELLQHLTGGSLKTSGWTRVEGTDTGIIVVAVDNAASAISASDVGNNIVSDTDGDVGTLLEVLTPTSGGLEYLVIRPDSNVAGNSFDNSPTAGDTLTCNANQSTQNSASVTGEQIWANLYNVTPIDDDTHVYMYQGTVDDATRARVADINDAANADTQDWWAEGAFDRCYPMNDYTAAGFPVIDAGYITAFARKGNTLTDNFEVLTSLVSGGRNPVPLSASADGNNTTGYQSVTLTANPSDTYAVGDIFEGGSSGAKGVITLIEGTTPTYTLHYYLIGDPQITFNTAAETVNGVSPATGTGTKNTSAPANQGAALATWFEGNAFPTMTYAATTYDVEDDGTAEGYGGTADLMGAFLTEFYQWNKYIHRNGETGTTPTDGIEGEQHIGPEVYLGWSGTVSGTMTEGNPVTQTGTDATGIIVSKDETTKEMLLRNVRGTFNTSGLVTDDTASGTVTPNTAAEVFNPVKAAPLGTLAGGRMFFARGIVPTGWHADDENSWETIPTAGGGAQTRPIAITLSMSNLTGTGESTSDDDRISLHRLLGDGLDVNKTEYSSDGVGAAGDATLDIDAPITADTAGKAAGAWLNIRDASDNNEHYMIRFDSWNNTTNTPDGEFVLSNFAAFVSTTGTSTTQVSYTTGGFGSGVVKRGDLVYAAGKGVSYVTTVDDDNTLQIYPAIATLASGDTVEINCLPIAMDALDDVYVSMIDGYASASTASASIVYSSPLFYRATVSNTRNATKLQRFVADDTTSGTSRNVATVRNEDTIHV